MRSRLNTVLVKVVMRVSKEDELHLWTGGNKPVIFKYCIERSMTKEIINWLTENCTRGYGADYYYSHGEIWFKQEKMETLFTLRWL
jgi:hypothetical protein